MIRFNLCFSTTLLDIWLNSVGDLPKLTGSVKVEENDGVTNEVLLKDYCFEHQGAWIFSN